VIEPQPLVGVDQNDQGVAAGIRQPEVAQLPRAAGIRQSAQVGQAMHPLLGAQSRPEGGIEIANGNQSTFFDSAGKQVGFSAMDFPRAPRANTRTGHWDSPEQQNAATNQYKAEVNAWRTQNGLAPLDQAQATKLVEEAGVVVPNAEALQAQAQATAELTRAKVPAAGFLPVTSEVPNPAEFGGPNLKRQSYQPVSDFGKTAAQKEVDAQLRAQYAALETKHGAKKIRARAARYQAANPKATLQQTVDAIQMGDIK